MKTSGLAAAGVAGVMAGASGVARAQPPPGCNIEDPNGDQSLLIVHPTGTVPYDDPQNPGTLIQPDGSCVQHAVDIVAEGGTIVLKHVSGTPFQFKEAYIGYDFDVEVWKSCTIEGETDGVPTKQFPNGTPLTTIMNGVGNFGLGWGSQGEVVITLRNLVVNGSRFGFSGAYGSGNSSIVNDNIKVLNHRSAAPKADAIIPFWSHNTGTWTVKNCEVHVVDTNNGGTEFGIVSNIFGGHCDVTITNNTVTTPSRGIGNVLNSGSSLIEGNHVTAGLEGFILHQASNNTVRNNTVHMTDYAEEAFTLLGTENNTIENNTITGICGYAFKVESGSGSHYHKNDSSGVTELAYHNPDYNPNCQNPGDIVTAPKMLPIPHGVDMSGLGKYLEFRGYDVVDCGTGPSISNALSIAAWVKNPTGLNGHLVNRGGGWDGPGYSLIWYDGKLRVELQRSGEKMTADAPIPSDGEWHHIALTWPTVDHSVPAASETSGKIGNAIEFTGSDRIFVEDDSDLDITGPITMAAWIFPYVTNINTKIIGKSHTECGSPYHMYALGTRTNGTVAVELAIGGSGVYVETPGTIPANDWTHVAATYDGNEITLYINGNPAIATLQNGSIDTNDVPLTIGFSPNCGDFFQGKIDEVHLFDQALLQGQIQSLMTTNGAFGGEVAYWSMDLDDSQPLNVVNDTVGGHTGVINEANAVIYIDGEAKAGGVFNGPIGNPAQNLNLGRNELYDFYFTGFMDEVAIWDQVLDESHISTLADPPAKPNDQGMPTPAAYWNCDETLPKPSEPNVDQLPDLIGTAPYGNFPGDINRNECPEDVEDPVYFPHLPGMDVYLDPQSHGNVFENNKFGGTGYTGALIEGYENTLQNNRFAYPGWVNSDGEWEIDPVTGEAPAGAVLITGMDNTISALKDYQQPNGFDVCNQVLDLHAGYDSPKTVRFYDPSAPVYTVIVFGWVEVYVVEWSSTVELPYDFGSAGYALDQAGDPLLGKPLNFVRENYYRCEVPGWWNDPDYVPIGNMWEPRISIDLVMTEQPYFDPQYPWLEGMNIPDPSGTPSTTLNMLNTIDGYNKCGRAPDGFMAKLSNLVSLPSIHKSMGGWGQGWLLPK